MCDCTASACFHRHARKALSFALGVSVFVCFNGFSFNGTAGWMRLLCAMTVMSTTLTCTITGVSITIRKCTVWHCAYLSLQHTGNVRRSVDELKRSTKHCKSAKTAGTCRACSWRRFHRHLCPVFVYHPVSPPSVAHTHNPRLSISTTDGNSECA